MVNAGTTGSERMRRGGIETVVGGDGISRTGRSGRRPGPRRTATPCSGRRKRRRGFRRSWNRHPRRRHLDGQLSEVSHTWSSSSYPVEAPGESPTQEPLALNASAVEAHQDRWTAETAGLDGEIWAATSTLTHCDPLQWSQEEASWVPSFQESSSSSL